MADNKKKRKFKAGKDKSGVFETLMGAKEVKSPGKQKDGRGAKPRFEVASTPSEDIKKMGKGAIGALSIPDNLFWAAMTPGKTLKGELENIKKDFPDSVLEKGTEADDFLEALGADKDHIASKVGAFVLNSVGPGGAAKLLSKAVGKELPAGLGHAAIQAYAKDGKKRAARRHIERIIKEKGYERGEVGPIVEAIDEDDLYTKLKDPEAIRDYLEGRMRPTRKSGDNYVGRERRSGGELGDRGREIFDIVKRAEQKSGKKVSRGGIARDIIKKAKNTTDSTSTSVSIDTDKLQEFLDRRLKHTAKERPPRVSVNLDKTDLPPDFNSSILPEYEEKLTALTREADEAKKLRARIDAQKKEREIAEKEVSKDNSKLLSAKEKAAKEEADKAKKELAEKAKERDAEAARRKKVIEDSKKERAANEEKAMEHNEWKKSQLKEAKADHKLKTKPPEPKNPKPIPRTTKKGEPVSPRHKLNLESYNKKAQKSIEDFKRSRELPPVKTLEERIAAIKEIPKMTADDLGPPPLFDEMFGELPPVRIPERPNTITFDELKNAPLKEVDVPPPQPYVGRPIEDINAEIQDVKNVKSRLEKNGSRLAKQDQAQYKQRLQQGEQLIHKDVESNPTELLKLRQELDKELSNVYNRPLGKMSPDERTEHGKILALRNEIDNRLRAYLDDVNLDEGNAGEMFDKANEAFGARKDLSNLSSKEGQKARTGKSLREQVLPKVVGGLGTMGIAAGTGHGGLWAPAAVGGAIAGDMMWSNMGHDVTAGALRHLEDPLKGGATTGLMQEGAEWIGGDRAGSSKPIEVQNGGEELDWSLFNKVNKGRGPNAVVEMPEEATQSAMDTLAPPQDVEQKMEERLNPGIHKPVFDPYINDEVLNTPLPRDSARLLSNPKAVRAKIGQLAPKYIPMLEDAMANDPDYVKEQMPKIAMMFPDAFEQDKYGMFDGKLPPDPMVQQKFFADLEEDEGIDSIEKATIAMKAHRGASIF